MATAAQMLQPDREAIESFLADYIGQDIHLVSIRPDTEEVKGQWFGADANRAALWAVSENKAGKGVYWTVNVCRAGLNKKPTGGKADPAVMGDMVAHRFLHCDIDPPKDGSPWSIEAAGQALAEMRFPPSFSIASGGGIGAYWRLDESVANKPAVTNANRGLSVLLGGDNCHNHDRIMRLPGTVNWPNRKKAAAGREPALARILEPDDGVVYPLMALATEYPAGETEGSASRERVEAGSAELLTADDLNLAQLHILRRMIEHPKGADRSKDAYACAGYMVRYRYSDAQIIGILLNPANAVSAHCLAQRGAERRAAERCIEGTRADLKRQAEGGTKAADKIGLTDFYAYMPMHNYIYVPTRETWPATSVNSRLPDVPVVDANGEAVIGENGKPVLLRPSQWLDENRPVEQMTWAPGEPMHVPDRLISDGGWIDRKGASCFNLYRGPIVAKGDTRKAGRWLDHIHYIYPAEAEHLIQWLAHRVQRPGEKINHAIVLGGAQGIGKDTMLEPVKYGVGPWNFQEVSPQNLLGRFNGFLKSVILRVSEARDLGDVDRFAFYDHMKTYTAAPPDVLRVDEKNLREYAIFNVCGVIITTNHKTDGIYLPADDRRHFVAWSERERDDFEADYWPEIYGWFAAEGNRNVAGYLSELDLSGFNPKAPPTKTEAFWSIVDANRAPEDAELADALEKMMHPSATTIQNIAENASDSFREFLIDRRNIRKIPHRLEECGYVAVRNPTSQKGLWRVNGQRQVIYARKTLSLRDRIEASEKLASFRSSSTRF